MKRLLILAALAVMLGGEVRADFLLGWDFQTTSSGGTSLVAQDTAQPKVLRRNVGAIDGFLYLDGTNGSSNWTSSNTNTREINAFAGTNVNATNGLSTTTTSPAALALLNTTANNKSIVFKFDMTGYKDLVISLAAQRTDTGFNSQVWEGSTNGTTWSSIGTLVGGTTSGTIRNSFSNTGVLTLGSYTGVDNSSTAYVRVTFSGASSASGNNRLDNIQFSANAVPEPTTGLLLGVGTLACAAFRRNRRVA
ncbi:MAG: PEP-CTERM sorting domain-containing protein [Planctomycetota bacterium]|jgi:hypothetical protein